MLGNVGSGPSRGRLVGLLDHGLESLGRRSLGEMGRTDHRIEAFRMQIDRANLPGRLQPVGGTPRQLSAEGLSFGVGKHDERSNSCLRGKRRRFPCPSARMSG